MLPVAGPIIQTARSLYDFEITKGPKALAGLRAAPEIEPAKIAETVSTRPTTRGPKLTDPRLSIIVAKTANIKVAVRIASTITAVSVLTPTPITGPPSENSRAVGPNIQSNSPAAAKLAKICAMI